MSRASPRPVLNLSGAAIHGPEEEKHPSILLPNQQEDVSHFAIDIGGEHIKFARGLQCMFGEVDMAFASIGRCLSLQAPHTCLYSLSA
jgi:hypothetical protein